MFGNFGNFGNLEIPNFLKTSKKWRTIWTSEIRKYSFRLENRPESSAKSLECRALIHINQEWKEVVLVLCGLLSFLLNKVFIYRVVQTVRNKFHGYFSSGYFVFHFDSVFEAKSRHFYYRSVIQRWPQ